MLVFVPPPFGVVYMCMLPCCTCLPSYLSSSLAPYPCPSVFLFRSASPPPSLGPPQRPKKGTPDIPQRRQGYLHGQVDARPALQEHRLQRGQRIYLGFARHKFPTKVQYAAVMFEILVVTVCVVVSRTHGGGWQRKGHRWKMFFISLG